MSFRWNHYVPVLRLKKGELWALRYVETDVRRSVTPIIELLSRNFERTSRNPGADVDRAVELIAKDLWVAWGDRAFFLDAANVGEFGIQTGIVERLAQRAIIEDLSMIPMVGLGGSSRQIPSARKSVAILNRGCALRLKRGHVDSSDTPSMIADLLARLEVKGEDVDLVIDLGISTGYPSFSYILNRVVHPHEWRSFTVLSGAFPKDLQAIKPGVHRIGRSDWRYWSCELAQAGANAVKPAFGDYTVQYAHYMEPPKSANPSASIRYTSDDEWILMRGEGIFNEDSEGNRQWPANAMLLSEMREFCGAAFSAGDRYIAEHADMYKAAGNPTTWIRAAINHHLIFTARQIVDMGNAPSTARVVTRWV